MITPRQLQVLRLYANGLTSIEIAAELAISVRTVEQHLQGVRRDLDAKNSVHAVALAMQKGIIKLIILLSVYQGMAADYHEDMRRPPQFRVRITRTQRREC
ncbi:hypothetical protein PP411_gp58 [Vibrio phage vB_VpP_BT-1011]|uniref:HTH luxR-type domain-containing protein n=1 Tax=Vibrio phage vB_VpP_BT-1011 TaxID=2799672 RepID=A0A8F3BEA5_9CAUD|nr:hypothetical protein PP411_gp58 [Vibrio phage vB_VpP_BT-1011]QWX10257.1 hypothetical protein vBVpPBT1011_0058 [Vibrio phage vB_VpP_BT-1011]